MATDFTVSDVLAWARTKPAGEEYDFTDSFNCAVAQFGRETDRPHLIGLLSEDLRATSELLAGAVVEYDDCRSWRRTFGGLVGRLEALVPAPVAQSQWTSADAYLADIEQVSA